MKPVTIAPGVAYEGGLMSSQDQAQHVTAFMEAAGFEETMLGNYSGHGEMVSFDMATFMWRATVEARLDETNLHISFAESSVPGQYLAHGHDRRTELDRLLEITDEPTENDISGLPPPRDTLTITKGF